MPKKDFAQIAFDVVQRATGDAPVEAAKSARQENSRSGGVRGGKARAQRLSPEQRSEIARTAAGARWKKG